MAPYLPMEIHVKIMARLFSVDDFNVIRDEHKVARTKRLETFRHLAGVCKDWLDPARALFWGSVALFDLLEFFPFTHAINDPSAKPGCIRNVYIRLPSYVPHRLRRLGGLMRVAQEAMRCFPAALLRLPSHLRVLHVDCNTGTYPYQDVHNYLQETYRNHPSRVIDVDKLEIGSRHDRRDVFPIFVFVHNVRRLALTVSLWDAEDTFGVTMHIYATRITHPRASIRGRKDRRHGA